MKPRYLYIHAPFCARRCSYCDFAVTVDRSPDAGPWLASIERELAAAIDQFGWSRPEFETIYVGGGTPSLLGAGVMLDLRHRLERFADFPSGLEWTAEANPEHFGPDLAADWRHAGVNRLSMGAQTFDPAVLEWMGRLHGPEGPVRAIGAARAAGFDDISIDLIFGVPARLGRDWRSDLERVIGLETEHVSLYGLTAESATPLGKWVAEGRERLAEEEEYEEEYLLAAELLTAAGHLHYEVSNFARPGRQSRHNLAYWTGEPYLGLGPGAHSFVEPERWWNVRDWAAYHGRVQAAGLAIDGREQIDEEAASLERAWLGLRTSEGAQIRTTAQRDLADTWTARGLAEPSGGGVRLTARGWLLLDRLAVDYSEAGLKDGTDAETLMDHAS